MIVLTDPAAAHQWTRQTASDKRVAIVPTMGALHQGHLSLVKRARQVADEVVVSIFVNPTQFGPSEDLARYPRPFEEDLSALRSEHVAMVFCPSPATIYPEGFSTYIEPPHVASLLEGRIRPGHFRGVCTVVLKLFQIIPATVAVFGQKDYQQSRVIVTMVKDLNLPIEIDIAPTIRESDGLAMSSRNRYLDEAEHRRALCISRSLRAVQEEFLGGQREPARLEASMRENLRVGSSDGVDQLDYAVVVNRETLQPVSHFDEPMVALIAARVGTTRLIDNVLLSSEVDR